jgi:senataxin
MMNQNTQTDWREVEEGIIKNARIICTTLSMSGIEKLEIMKDKFEYLIIDEACQSTEPSTLIPFSLGSRRVVMVGD